MEAVPQQAEPVVTEPAEAAAQPTRKRGASGYPRGVSKCAKGGRFQGRASYKPLGAAKAEQRSVGTFATEEEAAAAVIAAEEQLKAGNDPWQQPVRKNQHARGEVRRPVTAHHHSLTDPVRAAFVSRACRRRPRSARRSAGTA